MFLAGERRKLQTLVFGSVVVESSEDRWLQDDADVAKKRNARTI
jgi:hypothetical protein